MKRWFKITVGVTIVIVLLVVIDIVCIFTINRPLLAMHYDGGNVYRGIFYDTYNCTEYSIPQIKLKGTKFSCSDVKINTSKVLSIKDTSKDINDFACASMLESFYEDNEFTYYWSCTKNDYVIVEYENGYKETVSDALKYKAITLDDLDRYNIEYIKYPKDNN